MKLFIFFCMVTLMASCGKMSDGTSVWAEGLWIIPTLTTLATLFFGYKAGKQHSGGSWKIIGGWVTDEDGGKIPIWKTPYFVFFVGFFLATIGVIFWVNLEK